MAERRPMRIVHTSDVHLGAYSGNEGHWAVRRSLIETAFSRVIDLATNVDADALLIAGDFFKPLQLVFFIVREVRLRPLPAREIFVALRLALHECVFALRHLIRRYWLIIVRCVHGIF